MSIRTKIIIAIAICLLLVCGCISPVVYTLAQKSSKESFYSLSLSELRRIEERISTFLEPGEMTIKYLSETELVKRSRGQLTNYTQTTETTTLLYDNHNDYEKLLYAEFIKMRASNSNFGLVFMANDDGEYFQAPEGSIKTPHYDPRLRSWWSEVMESDEPVTISTPYLTTGGGMVCSIMTKTYDMTGIPLGMVGVDYSLESLTGDLNSRQILKSGYVVIFDSKGNIIVDGHHPEYILADPDTYSDLRKHMLEIEQGVINDTGSSGIDQYVVTYKMQSTGWTLAVVFDHSEMMISSNSLLYAVIFTSVAVFVAALILGIMIAKNIVKPIEQLTQAAAIISKGEYENSSDLQNLLVSKLDIKGGGESRELAEALKIMIEALQNRVELAQSAARAKSEFLSKMSHEIRTPINAITSMTTIGKRSNDPDRKDYAFNKIENASEHLLAVINDVLDMSNVEYGKISLVEVRFNLSDVIEEVVYGMNFRITEKQHTFSSRIDRNIPPVLVGDDGRIAQVITNLLSNAIKFTPPGGKIALNAVCVSETEKECEIRVSITDNGIGVDKNDYEHLFEPFRQGENSASRKYGGSGLGLSISKHIVELMGGNIWVDSQLGKGSTFHFSAILKRGDGISLPAKKKDLYTTVETTNIKNVFKGYRALLVEDVAVNREIVIALLEPTGIIIECVENGLQAVERFNELPAKYDLIFMDMQMPVMDGLEATRCIREMHHDNSKSIPIIAITANALKEDARTCIDAGMNAHIGKPINFGYMMKLMYQYLPPKQ